MKNRVLKVGAVLGALMLPVAAHAQVVTGAVVGGILGGPVGALAGAMIGGVNVAAFSDYVASRSYPVYVYNGGVKVGTVLPSGVVYYRVPDEYVAPSYYAIVNGHTVLVDPTTQKIIQVVN
jgi:Protein of unknown function (DUF1236)